MEKVKFIENATWAVTAEFVPLYIRLFYLQVPSYVSIEVLFSHEPGYQSIPVIRAYFVGLYKSSVTAGQAILFASYPSGI